MKMKKRGFTLIEVMTVVAIIIILTTMVSFSISEYITRSQYVSSRASSHVNKYNAARIQVDALNMASPETTTPTPDPNEPTIADITETNADDRCDVVFVNWDGTQLSKQSIFIGQAAEAPKTNPVRAGWTFTGWDVAFDNITGPLTITAVFSQNTCLVKFTYYTNATGTEQTTTAEQPVFVGSDASSLAPVVPARTGYTFTGWTPATTNVTVDRTFTAQYAAISFTITFNSNGGSAVSSIMQNYGTPVTVPTPPTRAGYTFTGWSPAVPATMPIGGAALTAQWTVNSSYTITFNSNGGSAVSSITQPSGSAVTAPTPPTRAGYTFTGWSPAVPATMPVGGAALTAQWTAPLSSVSISGTTRVGNTLTATVVPSGATANYTWSRSTSANGTYTSVSSGSTYTLTSADFGKFIKVTATGTGSYTGTVTSASVGAVTACPLSSVTVDKYIKSSTSTATVSPAGATVTYQWWYKTSAGGSWTKVYGATSATYKLPYNSGRYYQVVVTGTGGYSGTVSTSGGPT